ncbi:MAG: Gfo/Idh/MocA family oxidoreductase [Flavobacteriaceae bacterium]|nr:Gfo/Idh/MocA family oxidoreductase [Flavobacteriaceae bacterium]MCI5088791.1 Gfo/Idh/MocA family oxidoreductase [Flavobacteriaceae bacterium]
MKTKLNLADVPAADQTANAYQLNRKEFVQKLSFGGLALSASPSLFTKAPENILKRTPPLVNNNLQIALIGAGGMGSQDTMTALSHPGIKLVAVCDLYQGHLDRAKEKWGPDIFTSRDYKEILSRPEVDAVIIGTPDHWHKQISIDAMYAGKHVYCEKPMVHSLEEGHAVIEAQRKTGMVFMVGSQGLSSLGNEKARELLAAGAIGDINYAEGFWARRSPTGAWQYNIPSDASTQTVDWDTFLSNTKKRDFDPMRFFRWRNYRDYGTGMSGDLFVHLFSSLHFITNSYGPNQIYASGGLRYWKDGREVPDVMLGVFDYPETPQHPAFNLSLRCNFVDGTSGTTYLRIVGSEGAMDVQWEKVIVRRNGETFETDPYLAAQSSGQTPNKEVPRKKIMPQQETVYSAEKGYLGAHYDHFGNWFAAIRGGKAVVEDAIFGYRAAAPALACNDSYYKNKPIFWDPKAMKIIQ